MIPDMLYHYYDCSRGPFCNLSDLAPEAAEAILNDLRRRGEGFASQRKADYLTIRRELEIFVRQKFIEKGGLPQRERPHYMILGRCDWVKSWYRQGRAVQISLDQFEATCVSFTYGDTFPAMRYNDGKAYRRQVYTVAELPALVEQYGLPQEWNADGTKGPDRYIEAQIWDDRPLRAWL